MAVAKSYPIQEYNLNTKWINPIFATLSILASGRS